MPKRKQLVPLLRNKLARRLCDAPKRSSTSLRLIRESLRSSRGSKPKRRKLHASHVRQRKRLLLPTLNPQAVMRHLKTQTAQATEITTKTTSECRKADL